MNAEAPSELEHLISCLEDFHEQRHHHVEFVKESFLNGEYFINPKVIAAKWLNSCFAAIPEPCVED
jgi:hypothetical protein